jgi:hypothetical protein
MLTGCAGIGSTAGSPVVSSALISGKLSGGQQPVSGATMQLYAAGTTGYGSAATPLLTAAVATDSHGNFNITGDYTCPANAQVYLVATKGNPGLAPGSVNNNLALMAGLGACSGLQTSGYVMVNELTTVATVWALSRFMSGYAAVGTSAGNATGLANAFAVIPELVDPKTGAIPGPALPANAVLPSAELNTLADALAACVNSGGGAAGDMTACGQLFSATTVSGSSAGAPQDTIGAALNLALHPTMNPSAIVSLAAGSGAPFQPTLPVAPQNFLVAITYSGGGLSAPSAIAPDAVGNVWLANAGNSTLTELSPSGAAISPAGGFGGGGLNAPSALAIDQMGTVWVTNRSGNSVSVFSGASGAPLTASPISGGGLSAPSGVAIDEDGSAWVTNSGNNSVSAISSAFQMISPASGFTGGGLSQPVAVAIDPQ